MIMLRKAGAPSIAEERIADAHKTLLAICKIFRCFIGG
jgi:hypothetical protein